MKLSGDGTWIGHRKHIVIFSYTLLEEEDTVASVDGVHPLVVFQEPEVYGKLDEALVDVRQEVKKIQTEGITVEGVKYTVSLHVVMENVTCFTGT